MPRILGLHVNAGQRPYGMRAAVDAAPRAVVYRTAMAYEQVLYDVADGVATITSTGRRS